MLNQVCLKRGRLLFHHAITVIVCEQHVLSRDSFTILRKLLLSITYVFSGNVYKNTSYIRFWLLFSERAAWLLSVWRFLVPTSSFFRNYSSIFRCIPLLYSRSSPSPAIAVNPQANLLSISICRVARQLNICALAQHV